MAESKFSWLTSESPAKFIRKSKQEKSRESLRDGGYGYFGRVTTRVIGILLDAPMYSIQPSVDDLIHLKSTKNEYESNFFSSGGNFIDALTSVEEYDAFLNEIISDVIDAIVFTAEMPHTIDSVILPTIPIAKIYIDTPLPIKLEFICDKLKVSYPIIPPTTEQLTYLWMKHSKQEIQPQKKKEFKCTFTFGRRQPYQIVLSQNPYILIKNITNLKETNLDILNIIMLLLYQNNI